MHKTTDICVEIKNPGEKLLRLYVTPVDGSIRSIRITGDFFIMPEEGIDKIESRLIGVKIDHAAIVETIVAVLSRERIEMIGLSPGSIAEGVIKAVKR